MLEKRRTMIRLLPRARSLTPNLSSESLRIKISVKTKLRSPPRKRLPRLRLRLRLRRRLPRPNCLKKRKNLLRPRRPQPMLPLKLMRDSHQNLPQLSNREAHGTSESEKEDEWQSRK